METITSHCCAAPRRFVFLCILICCTNPPLWCGKRMESKNLFLSLLLCYSLLRAASSHLIIEEKTECNLSKNNKMNLPDLPPISIVDLTKRSQKVSRKEAENKKSSKKNAKLKAPPKPRPTPAADCVPNFKTCKPHLNSCCNYCALCKCRIFQTICQCLLLNPKC